MKKVYQDGTNLLKVHNGNSFANLHTCPKLGLLQLVPHTAKNDPWSDHPETQFGPNYPFFRNHKPWPTLHT